MARLAMIIDMNRCVGCGACVIACQEEWELPPDVTRTWVRPLHPTADETGKDDRPLFTHDVGLCNHCENATCIQACPTGATYHDDKGRVVVDGDTCIGCGYCVEACPYGARTLRQEQGVVDKCDFCAARVDRGLEPACVETCPAGARIFGDLDDRDSKVAETFRTHRVRRNETPEVSIGPRVYHAGDDRVLDRVFASHRPDPDKTSPPLPGVLMRRAGRPGFFGLLGLVFTGQAIATFRQLRRGDERGVEEPVAGERTLPRHDTAIIWLHWFNAFVWLFQAVTGFAGLQGSTYQVTPGFFNRAVLSLFGSREVMFRFHIVLGLLWLAVLLVYGLFGLRRYLVPFLGELCLHRRDATWLRIRLANIFSRHKRELPPQDKYNAGQKLCGLVVALSTVVVLFSGLVMVLAPGSGALVQWAILFHFAAACAVVVLLVLHVYMAAFDASQRPVFFSMIHGRMPESHARKHYRLWWERQMNGSDRNES